MITTLQTKGSSLQFRRTASPWVNWKSARNDINADHHFWPLDVAIGQVIFPCMDRPPTITAIFFEMGSFHISAALLGSIVVVFGAASISSRKVDASAMKSQSDGQYRVGFFKTTSGDNDSGRGCGIPARRTSISQVVTAVAHRSRTFLTATQCS